MNKSKLTESIINKMIDSGFHKVGISAAKNPEKSKLLEKWLNKNFHGEMKWMENYREKRLDVQNLFPDAKSVVSVAHNYFSPGKHFSSPQHGKISRYAWGEDYHVIMKKKLKQVLLDVKKLDNNIEGRISVDTAPAMDKLWAEKSGIGWQGKHTNIISKEFGSWIFLGELILNVELEYDKPGEDFCGSCTACIDACPTDAIVQPYILDARKCISYLTIEYWDKPIANEFQNKMDNWIFGCDICQDVCPWNKFQQRTDEIKYLPKEGNINPKLDEIAILTENEFKQQFKKSPVNRTGWKNFIRNVKTIIESHQKNDT
jgi:epoxyqueuosine reductase